MTSGFFHSSAGGSFAAELKYAGFDGVDDRGQERKPGVSLVSAMTALSCGMPRISGESEPTAPSSWLKRDIGDEAAQLAVIGPAGERLVRFATLWSEAGRSGSGGMGAVLGSKKFKGLAVRGTASIEVA